MSVFGAIVTTHHVRTAILDVLRTWMVSYLAELERQSALEKYDLYRPRSPDDFRGGIDFETWKHDDLPAYIVTCVPAAAPDRLSEGYAQLYEVAIGVIVGLPTEDESRMIAAYHGAAAMGALLQHGDLDGLAVSTVMVEAPAEVFPDDDERRIVRSESTYHVLVDAIVDELAGPTVPQDDDEAPYPDWPTVLSTDLTITPVEEI